MFLSAIARAGRAIEGLGRDAGCALVTPQIARLMEEAGRRGAAAKPSGAGGGDVAIVFSASAEIGAEITKAAGLEVIEVAIDPVGLRRES